MRSVLLIQLFAVPSEWTGGPLHPFWPVLLILVGAVIGVAMVVWLIRR
jgi:hypothetical protein